MNTQEKIAFIGSGVMGEAIIAGLINRGLAQPGQLNASDPRPERGEELREHYGIVPFTDNTEAACDASVVILSVKPQRLERVLDNLKSCLRPDTLVISIVAGATIHKITTGLSHDLVVRAMPNTPAQIGEGITVWTTSSSVTQAQSDVARQILSALGEEVFVEEENYLDMATALSGSGPAYIFLFLEAMIDAGVHLGLPRRLSEKLVEQTIRGSVDFYSQSKTHPAALRNQVTSPGGTSAAALYYLEKAGFRTAISRAIWAAYERAQELGSGSDSHPPEKN